MFNATPCCNAVDWTARCPCYSINPSSDIHTQNPVLASPDCTFFNTIFSYSLFYGRHLGHATCPIMLYPQHDPAPPTLPIYPLHVISGPCITQSHISTTDSRRVCGNPRGGAHIETWESHHRIPRNRNQALTWTGVRIPPNPLAWAERHPLRG